MELRPWDNFIKLRYLLICVVTVDYCVTRTDLKLHYMVEWDLLKLKKQWHTPQEWKLHLFIFFVNGEGNKETTLPFNSIKKKKKKNWTGLITASSRRDRTDCSFRGYSESFLLLGRWSVRWIYGGTCGQHLWTAEEQKASKTKTKIHFVFFLPPFFLTSYLSPCRVAAECCCLDRPWSKSLAPRRRGWHPAG